MNNTGDTGDKIENPLVGLYVLRKPRKTCDAFLLLLLLSVVYDTISLASE